MLLVTGKCLMCSVYVSLPKSRVPPECNFVGHSGIVCRGELKVDVVDSIFFEEGARVLLAGAADWEAAISCAPLIYVSLPKSRLPPAIQAWLLDTAGLLVEQSPSLE